jgi:hypothetical protein
LARAEEPSSVDASVIPAKAGMMESVRPQAGFRRSPEWLESQGRPHLPRTRSRRRFKLLAVLVVGIAAGIAVGMLLVELLIAN